MKLSLSLTVAGAVVWGAAGQAACSFPPRYDLQQVEYKIERIDSSSTVQIKFPDLSKLDCEEVKVTFGTIWKFDLKPKSAIDVTVLDRNGITVQDFQILGEFEMKDTPDWGQVRFFKSAQSKPISDHRLVSLDLWSKTAASAPQLNVEDSGNRRLIPAKVTVR